MVADSLMRQMAPGVIDVQSVHQLTPDLAEPISQAGRVIFIDAGVGDIPGEVRIFPLELDGSLHGTHQTSPQALLALADALYGRCPPAHMVTITGENFELSESLSPVVAGAVAIAVREVCGLLKPP